MASDSIRTPETDPAPQEATVRVKATAHLGELESGTMRHYLPGQMFVTTLRRARALGSLVQILN